MKIEHLTFNMAIQLIFVFSLTSLNFLPMFNKPEEMLKLLKWKTFKSTMLERVKIFATLYNKFYEEFDSAATTMIMIILYLHEAYKLQYICIHYSMTIDHTPWPP